jgi:hypothetical protein
MVTSAKASARAGRVWSLALRSSPCFIRVNPWLNTIFGLGTVCRSQPMRLV